METFAEIMGDVENEAKYGALADRLKDLVKAKFWDQPVKEKSTGRPCLLPYCTTGSCLLMRWMRRRILC
jgi:hypothetical protein